MTPFYSKAYLSTQVNTSDPLALVIAMYEAAIANVTQAMEAIEAGDTEKRGRMIGRTSEILMALSEALDYTQQHQIAGRLFCLYNTQLELLLKANRENDLESLQAVKSTLSIVLSGWHEAARSPEAAELREASCQMVPAAGRPVASSERLAVAMTA